MDVRFAASARDTSTGVPEVQDVQQLALWTGCEAALPRVIAEQPDQNNFSWRLLARYGLEIPDSASTEPDPPAR